LVGERVAVELMPVGLEHEGIVSRIGSSGGRGGGGDPVGALG